MNKRKCVKSQLEMQQTNNMQIKNLYNTNGITLIALVISIIVMLILAGVSLNATIGENGIMTQAKNATYMQGIATLEEYLQSEYVKYYDEADNYTNNVELLVNKISNLCLKDGTKNYITYDGKMHYLLNKQALPEEIRNQLRGGDTTDYLSYIRLKDVYGITEDLRVYYCSEGTDNVLGTLNTSELNPNTPLVKVNTDNEIKSAISDALLTVGVEVGENGVTVGDASKIKDLELDGSKYNITSISALSEISTLKTLTLSNLTLDNLDGLENCTLLTGIYFKNCKVNNYTKLSTAWNLQYLYLYLPPTMSEADANAQVEKLGEGLVNATEIKNLEYFGISGTTDMFEGEYSVNTGAAVSVSKYHYNSTKYSNLKNIDNLKNIPNNIKNSIKYLYLNNNSFENVEALNEYKSIYEVDLMCNKNLLNLDGMENNSNLVYLFAQNCNLNNIEGLKGNVNLRFISMKKNNELESLLGLEDSKNLDYVLLSECNIQDITAFENNTKLRFLSLSNNVNLESVKALGTCIGIKKLYLDGNVNMIGTEVRDALADPVTHILQNCGRDYRIPSKYNIYFTTLTSYDYSNMNLTDDSDEINSLKNKTNVTRLNLSGNKQLSNAKLQEILSTMTGLKYLSLTSLNLENLDFLNNVKNLIELDVRNCNSLQADLSTLNNSSSVMQTFVTNNTNIDLTKIQIAINNISNNRSEKTLESWISLEPWNARGFITIGNSFNYNECTNITKFTVDANSFGNTCDIDLSNCNNLTFVHLGYGAGNAKLPASVTRAEIKNTTKNVDLSLCANLQRIDFTNNTTSKTVSIVKIIDTLPYDNNLKNLYASRIEFEDLSFFENKNFSKLESLTLVGLDSFVGKIKNLNGIENAISLKTLKVDNTTIENIEALSSISSLEELYANKTKNLVSLKGIENSSNLKKINITDSTVYDIKALESLDALNELKLNQCKVSDISSLINLKQLSVLELHDNNISELFPLEELIMNGKIKFTELNLSNNLLQTTTLSGYNNVNTLEKLYNAGLQTLNISGNNFTAGSTDKLKNLSWTSYTE